MKTITIGRDEQSDIFIRDDSSVVSRRHAILKIEKNGSMTITDLSTNGTYINGIRIESNKQVPVSRKDDISFAYIQSLDWDIIPNVRKKFLLTVFGSCFAAVLVAGLIVFFVLKDDGTPAPSVNPTPNPELIEDEKPKVADSTNHDNDSVVKQDVVTTKEKPKSEKGKSNKSNKKVKKEEKNASKDKKENQHEEPVIDAILMQ